MQHRRRVVQKNAKKELAPQVGLEPTTLRLTAGCSAIELLRNTCLSAEKVTQACALA